MANLLEITGRETLSQLDYVGSLNIQLWATLRGMRAALPMVGNRHRWRATVHQMLEIGVDALPMVALMATCSGFILAMQGASELRRFGALHFVIDLVAVGFTRELGPLLTAIAVSGRSGSAFAAGTTQTAVNVSAGARTQVAEVVTAAMTLVTMFFLAPLVAMMPQSALAALVIVYSFRLIKTIEFRDILRIRRTEFSWAIVAFTGVVAVGTLKGIIVAIIVSLVTLAYQVADPPVYVLRRKPGTNVFRPQSPEHCDDESFPGLLLLRPEGPIFFANAAQIAHKIEPLVREAQPKVVAIEASGVLDMEYTAVKMFTQLAKRQRQHGVQLWLIGMTPRVLAIIQRSPLGQVLGREGMHFNLEIAVARYLDNAAAPDQPCDMALQAREAGAGRIR
jgi:SulP family sulfate permease